MRGRRFLLSSYKASVRGVEIRLPKGATRSAIQGSGPPYGAALDTSPITSNRVRPIF